MQKQVYQAHTKCPVCNHGEATLVAKRDGKTGQPLMTVECQQCGLGRIDPLPTKQALEDWYKNQYRQEYKGSFSPQMRHVLRAGRVARERWDWLKQYQPLPGAKTLDIGSSSGEFVYLMQSLGYEARGIEPHKGYAQHAQKTLGLNIYNAAFDECIDQVAQDSLDLITMFHVFEHVVEPVQTLGKIATKLKPDGRLFIEVPGTTAKRSPHSLFFKAHTLYFTENSLRQTLQAAGLRVIACQAPVEGNIHLVAIKEQSLHQAVVTFRNDAAISTTQRLRTVSRYIWRELTSGAKLLKLARSVEERLAVKQFTHTRECLNYAVGLSDATSQTTSSASVSLLRKLIAQPSQLVSGWRMVALPTTVVAATLAALLINR